jgi:hypothetical protein
MIPKSEMQPGWYICEGRCPPVCLWDGDQFQVLTVDCGFYTIHEQLHWDDDPKYGTVKPIKLLRTVLKDAGYDQLL